MRKRASGLLLHITSLPSPYGIGALGAEAYRFADFLAESGQSIWQVLPLNPTDPVAFNSPYGSDSSLAGNPLMISPDVLVEQGYLRREDLGPVPEFPVGRVDYGAAIEYKNRILDRAYDNFRRAGDRREFEAFSRINSHWLEDYALFVALKAEAGGAPWNEWSQEIRDRHDDALGRVHARLAGAKDKHKFIQFLFFKQWHALKGYCNDRGIEIFGDVPIYVSYDSVDVWTTPQIFKLKKDRTPAFVSGVPPDYFSKTGQLWGSPVYNWDELRAENFAWWVRRMQHNFSLFNLMRIDHFRGFAAFWEVPAGNKTAVNGEWVDAPGMEFFDLLVTKVPAEGIVAEDLGIITDDVTAIMKKFGLPGMKVLQFGFSGNLDENPYMPRNHEENSVVYTGTHDNNTTRGWYEHEATENEKHEINVYLSREVTAETVSREFIEMALHSPAHTAVIPVQDLLSLPAEYRMNFPGRGEGNWEWRLEPGQLTSEAAAGLRALTEAAGRVGSQAEAAGTAGPEAGGTHV
jgi:4-alpha-glucanotransferase